MFPISSDVLKEFGKNMRKSSRTMNDHLTFLLVTLVVVLVAVRTMLTIFVQADGLIDLNL